MIKSKCYSAPKKWRSKVKRDKYGNGRAEDARLKKAGENVCRMGTAHGWRGGKQNGNKRDCKKVLVPAGFCAQNVPGGLHCCTDDPENGYPFAYISDRFLEILGWERAEFAARFDNRYTSLVQMVSDQIRAREKNTDMLVGVLSQIVEFRKGESGSHVRHIRVITELLLHRLLELTGRYELTPEQQDNIALASALHDIGKIGIDEAILNKPGRLTAEEFAVIKTHSMLGAEMLHKMDNFAEQPLLQTAYEIARWHHERWDGKGYPDGLRGDDIPISAQLVSMADVYDALTSERCYKKAFPHETAVQMITNGECGAFNPLLIQCLLDVQGELKQDILQW